MVLKTLALHDQELEDAMLYLERCEDPRAQDAFEMANRGDIYPLNEEDLKPLRSKSLAVFDEDMWNSPILSGQQDLPFEFLPSARQIQEALTEDIGGKNFFRFAPSRASPERDAYATMDLLENIENPRFSERGAIIHMQSPIFDRLHTKTLQPPGGGILGQSNVQMTIAPASEVFDLQYCEHYHFSTLLTGSKVWIAYPPRHDNPLILQQQYEKLQGKKCGQVFSNIVSNLKHGIAVVQTRGQTLMIPPFWSFIAFCTETSTSAGYFQATVLSYMERLSSIDMWLTAIRMWPSKEQQQTELIKYVDSLASHLQVILNHKFSNTSNADKITKELCNNWDKEMAAAPGCGTLKAQITRLCNLIENKDEIYRIKSVFRGAWIRYLEGKRRKKAECRICHVRVSDMGKNDEDDGVYTAFELLVAHFNDVHWVF